MNLLKTASNLFALAALAAAPLVAQNGPLIGFLANSATPSSYVGRQELCNPPTRLCAQVLPAPPAAQVMAGGAFFDPSDRSVWHSEGTRILQVFPEDNCRQGCLVPGALALGIANSRIGGLTFDPNRRLIFQVESVPGVAAITIYRWPPGAACPQMSSQCRIVLPTQQHMSGGIAFDQDRDVLYMAASIPGTAAAQNTIFVLPALNPCAVICRAPVSSCSPTGSPLLAIQAAAYDECRDELYLSDGRQTSVQALFDLGPTACIRLVPQSCCPTNSPGGELWRGFDLEPGRARRIGFSCTDPTACANCPNMELSENGAAVVGNVGYGFDLDNAPTNGNAWLLIGFGPCQPIPFFCGRIYPNLAGAVSLGPLPLGGGVGACDGSASFNLSIPNNHALCGFQFCVQGIVTCPTTVGVGLTNGLEVTIGS